MNQAPTSGTSKVRKYLERFRRIIPFASGILATLLALFIYNFLYPANQLTEQEVNDAIFSALASATPRAAFSAEAYRVIQPSIVLIQTEIAVKGEEDNKSLGSGVIIDDVGDILTSLHVVDHATKISITFADGTQSDGTVVASQPEKDIAVLHAAVMPQLFVPATLGNPGAMREGDEVYVVGNPFGLYSSMSAGVISGFNRSFHPPNGKQAIEGLIQFDAAANPGNSGGPLLNRNGDVIGIVTGIVNPTKDTFFVGIGFAVPIDTAAGGIGSPPY